MQAQPQMPSPVIVPLPADLLLNEPNITIQGRRTVRIEALLDAEGLTELEGQIKALKMLIKSGVAAPSPKVVPTARAADDPAGASEWDDPDAA